MEKTMENKVYLYKVFCVDGSMFETALGRKATLKQLQGWVGGYVQQVQVSPQQWVIVNEEGLLKHLPKNPFFPGFVGNVVLLPPRCHA